MRCPNCYNELNSGLYCAFCKTMFPFARYSTTSAPKVGQVDGNTYVVDEQSLRAEIARLTADRDAALIRAERSERAEARAQVAAVAREAATVAYVCWQKGADAVCAEILKRITPDATAALAARDAAMRNEGRRRAAKMCRPVVRDAILAALEPEGGE